jgi:hypothetical protein
MGQGERVEWRPEDEVIHRANLPRGQSGARHTADQAHRNTADQAQTFGRSGAAAAGFRRGFNRVRLT